MPNEHRQLKPGRTARPRGRRCHAVPPRCQAAKFAAGNARVPSSRLAFLQSTAARSAISQAVSSTSIAGIDLATEKALTLTTALALPELQRDGRSFDLGTVYRWTTAGCCGCVLESVQIGGTRCTTREAVVRFITARPTRATPGPRPPRVSATKATNGNIKKRNRCSMQRESEL